MDVNQDIFNPLPDEQNQKYYDDAAKKYEDDAKNLPDIKVCLLVSHNSRMQCLLETIVPTISKKIRFQNCAIMELILSPKFVKLSHIYSGEITESEKRTPRPFYATDGESENPDAKFVKYKEVQFIGTTECDKIFKKLKIKYADVDPNGIKFYIIRHGISEHNENFFLKKLHYKLDTSLVESGKTAAINAGKFISTILPKIARPLYRIYVSDLKRTYQTVTTIMQTCSKECNAIKAIVLPCASEVANSGINGNCDEIGNMFDKMARENYPSCTIEEIKDLQSYCSKLDWSLYLKFYDNRTRGDYDSMYGRLMTSKPKKQQCRNTTVIAMAMYEMNPSDLDVFIRARTGGTRKNKRRKTKRVI
jgi:broad specificity phosphatase PhoE